MRTEILSCSPFQVANITDRISQAINKINPCQLPWQSGVNDFQLVFIQGMYYALYNSHFSAQVCENGGLCIDESDSHTCRCASGYTGSYCDIQIDECASNPCQHGATCTDQLDSYVCTCTPGFQGQNCEINIDDCKTSPCQNGGK